MDNELFRKEALEQAHRRLPGSVIIATPLRMWVCTLAVAAVLAAAVIFVSTTTYARKQTISGWLVPEGGVVKLTASQGGVVEAIGIREGQHVTPGANVASLRVTPVIAGGDVGHILAQSTQTQAEAMKNGTTARLDKLAAEKDELATRIVRLNREIEEGRLRVELQDESARIAVANLDRVAEFVKRGYVSQREFDTLRAAALATQAQTSAARAAVLTLERSLEEARSRQRELPAEIAAESAQLQLAVAALAERSAENESHSRYHASAPLSGEIAAVVVERGQYLTPGATIAVLLPDDAPLEAELFASSSASGFLRAGQEVRLQYKSYPYQRFGTGRGQIVSVSRSAIGPTDVTLPTGTFQEPVFKVRVRLADASISAYGEKLQLQAGMLVNADVIVERRSLLGWLLDPIYAASGRT